MSRWRDYLQEGESICWEGRPAPRAYTFRHWRWSAAGLIVAVAMFGAAVAAWTASYQPETSRAGILVCLGLLFFWGAVGHLVYARLAWEKEFYALTDRRLLLKSGLFCRNISAFDRKELGGADFRSMGASLATVSLRRGDGRPIQLKCLEHPEILLGKLFQAGK